MPRSTRLRAASIALLTAVAIVTSGCSLIGAVAALAAKVAPYLLFVDAPASSEEPALGHADVELAMADASDRERLPDGRFVLEAIVDADAGKESAPVRVIGIPAPVGNEAAAARIRELHAALGEDARVIAIDAAPMIDRYDAEGVPPILADGRVVLEAEGPLSRLARRGVVEADAGDGDVASR